MLNGKCHNLCALQATSCSEQYETCRELTDEDIRTAIKNSGGVKGSLLIPDAPFELLVRRSISCLLTPALQCKDFVHGELLRIAGQCAPSDITRFPALQVDTPAKSRIVDESRQSGNCRLSVLELARKCFAFSVGYRQILQPRSCKSGCARCCRKSGDSIGLSELRDDY